MVTSHPQRVSAQNGAIHYDRAKDIKAFDDSKAGVKGLVDSGIASIPEFFVLPPDEVRCHKSDPDDRSTQLQIPVIDLKNMHENGELRKAIVEQIRGASKEWGFFQVVNHGIPQDVVDETIEGVRRFNEQPNDKKMALYSRDHTAKVKFNSNFDLYQKKAANWRDTLYCVMSPEPPKHEELPAVCREIIIKYSEYVKKLGDTLFELLSEAIGLNSSHLRDMECDKAHSVVCHYYPGCPQPDRTLGITPHTDPDFFTVLLQDHIGGLQVLHQNKWVDIHPMTGALVINLGDLLQLLSNDKFSSAVHRVLANEVGPRISVATFFTTYFQHSDRLYGPIKELLSDDNPQVFRDTLVKEYMGYYKSKEVDSTALDYLRIVKQ